MNYVCQEVVLVIHRVRAVHHLFPLLVIEINLWWGWHREVDQLIVKCYQLIVQFFLKLRRESFSFRDSKSRFSKLIFRVFHSQRGMSFPKYKKFWGPRPWEFVILLGETHVSRMGIPEKPLELWTFSIPLSFHYKQQNYCYFRQNCCKSLCTYVQSAIAHRKVRNFFFEIYVFLSLSIYATLRTSPSQNPFSQQQQRPSSSSSQQSTTTPVIFPNRSETLPTMLSMRIPPAYTNFINPDGPLHPPRCVRGN